MIKVNKEGSDFYIEINSKKIEGTNTNNHVWRFRNNIYSFISDQDYDLFDTIKDFPIVGLPENVEFVFFQINLDELLYPLERLPYPFNNFTFIKEGSKYIFGMSCYLEHENWNRKWATSIYFDEIENVIKNKPEFIVRKTPDYSIHEDGFEFFIEIDVKNVKTISEAFEQALPKYNELIQQAEKQLSDVAGLLKIIDTWRDNQQNGNEEYWQNFFNKYSSIIAQAFSAPAYIFKDKAYLGGKGIENKSGKIVDFVFKGQNSSNLFLIEIKTPLAKLIGSKYRGTNTISSELSGSINQLLQYKDLQQKEYYSIKANSVGKYELFNPKCILIIGNLDSLKGNQSETFELFRHDLKSIEILTFDELFSKIEIVMELIKNN